MSQPIKNSKLALVKSKSMLKEKSDLNCAFAELNAQLQALGDLTQVKDCPSLVLHICELIENLAKPILKGSEKQELAIKLMLNLFPVLNNDLDISRIKKIIDFVVDMKLVKKISTATVAVNGVCGFLSKKLV